MSIFLITFISIYGSMNALAFFRLRGAFHPGQTGTLLMATWMAVMTFAPLIVRLAENAYMERTAFWAAWAGYIWMGSLFIFCSILFAFDTARVISWSMCRMFSSELPARFSSGLTCNAALLLTCIISAYALYEARHIRSDHVTLSTPKLSPSAARIRIVQISDVHVGILFRASRLNTILSVVKAAKPDILVSTGDLVDGKLSPENDTPGHQSLAAMLAAVTAPAGKFAVAGNHEFYAGIKQSLKFNSAAGFTTLRNQSVTLPQGIVISGVDDSTASRFKEFTGLAEAELLKNVPADFYRIHLKHQPIVSPASDGHFDLQLSGHVHNGQIFPFNLLVRLRYPIPCGTSETGAKSLIHVSRGSGTWGPPMRLLAPPEVTIIDIVPSVTTSKESP